MGNRIAVLFDDPCGTHARICYEETPTGCLGKWISTGDEGPFLVHLAPSEVLVMPADGRHRNRARQPSVSPLIEHRSVFQAVNFMNFQGDVRRRRRTGD